ncbi:MAG: hypothetical protein U0234_06075 [Sandaracinus sp.]
MRDRGIAKVVVCLLGLWVSGPARARAQDAAHEDEDASASVELALSMAPSALLALGGGQSGGLGGLAGLGGTGGVSGLFAPQLDAGFALDRCTLLVVGISGSFRDGPQPGYGLSVPVGVLWYLETPRLGRVMPMLRVGAVLSVSHQDLPPSLASGAIETFGAQALARGGITWLPARRVAIRAEIGVRGGADTTQLPGLGNVVGASLGLDALVGVVLRV